ncbi:hypothetical protein [Pedococcus sp. 5OH_020]|uniref:hypothetical protein n=1 Tax=Pedococcus sp. 5OH_020 TaxID=2989814 RepID=UPI0022E9A8A9|nr:hypothetical protein [Pedococcus sp. 5OH_020]
MALLVVAALLALVVPFVLVTRVFDAGTGSSASTGSPTSQEPARQPILATSSTTTTLASTAVSSSTTATSAGSSTSPLAGASEQCRLTNLRQQAALSAAAASLEQFQKHIDAMNLLVAGKISLPVARTFWNQTRIAATEKAQSFRAADQALTSSKAGCPELGPTAACSAPLQEVNAITACAKATAARQTVLVRARDSISTWEHHVHDMEMFRAGHMSAATMADKWQKTWKSGQQQLDSYSAAVQLTQKLRCPLT